MAERRRSRQASRQGQAFGWLLEEEGEHDAAGPARRRSGGGREQGRGRPVLLREEVQHQHGPSQEGALAQLIDLFGGSLPEDVISDVLQACGGSMEAATDALLAMSAPAAAVGGAGGARQEPAAAGGEAREPSGTAPCFWDWLPNEVKLLVLARLSVRDLARAAGTCAELARHVREQRQRCRTIVLPQGISMRAVRGAVAAFGGAPGVSLSRWGPSLRLPHQFEELFGAIALGEADRASGVPVRHVDLSRCGGMTDGDVDALCATLRLLDSIDLSHCTQLTDESLGPLSRYTRDVLPAAADDSPLGPASGGVASLSISRAEWEAEGDGGLLADQLGVLALAGGGGEAEEQGAGPQEQPAAGAARAGGAAAAGAVAPAQGAVASPSGAVRRLVAARHAAQLAAAKAAGAPASGSTAGGLLALRLREAGVTTGGLKQLLQGAGGRGGTAAVHSLEMLDVSGCPGVGPEGFHLGNKSALRVLRATGCLRLRSAIIHTASPSLEEVDLSGCRQLQEAAVVAPGLRKLSLSHCGVLSSLALNCRSLEELRCVNCGRLSSLELGAAPALRHLDLFGCRSLEAEGLEAAVQAGLPLLELLNLAGCISLSRLLLPEQAPRLQRLDVSGCGALRQVVAGSRALEVLAAKACSRLLEVRLHSATLRTLDLENCSHLKEVALPSGGPGRQAGAQLTLKGCTALPQERRRQLRAALAVE